MHNYAKYILKTLSAILIIALIIIISLSAVYTLFPTKHADIIVKYSNKYGVEPALVFALIKVESNFKEDAESSAGAKGLMQLTDETFAFCNQSLENTFSDEDILNPQANINAGIWYLKYLLKRYDGDTKNAVAAYNAGATNVDKWLGDASLSPDGKTLSEIPFGETARHAEKTDRYYRIYKFLYPDMRR